MENQEKKRGRPLIKKAKNDMIAFRVTPELKQELFEFAEAKGISVSSLATMWLKERIQTEKPKTAQKKYTDVS